MMSIPWQRELFYGLSTGLSMQNAFNEAMIEYPMCLGCMLFHGDRNLKLVPVVTRSLCDTLYDATDNPLTLNSRDYYIRCDVIVPEGEALTIYPSVRLAFMFGSAVIADGALLADGSAGTVQLLSDMERNRGIEITGTLRISNSGMIRIYDE